MLRILSVVICMLGKCLISVLSRAHKTFFVFVFEINTDVIFKVNLEKYKLLFTDLDVALYPPESDDTVGNLIRRTRLTKREEQVCKEDAWWEW